MNRVACFHIHYVFIVISFFAVAAAPEAAEKPAAPVPAVEEKVEPTSAEKRCKP